MTMIKLRLPIDPDTERTIDLDTLTPKARAVAEAIAQARAARILLRSNRPRRDLYRPEDAERFFTEDELCEPETTGHSSWWKCVPSTPQELHRWLEWEARKFPRHYPIADNKTDLPSSQDARLDDGLTVDQVLELIRLVAPGKQPGKDAWMRKATKGVDGYPAPVRHNGYRSLWSEAQVREFAAGL